MRSLFRGLDDGGTSNTLFYAPLVLCVDISQGHPAYTYLYIATYLIIVSIQADLRTEPYETSTVVAM